MPWDLVSHYRTCTHVLTQHLCPGKHETKIALEAADPHSFLGKSLPYWTELSHRTRWVSAFRRRKYRHGHPRLAKSAFLNTSTRSSSERSSPLLSFIFLNCSTKQCLGEPLLPPPWQQQDGTAQVEEGQELRPKIPPHWTLGDSELPHSQQELHKQNNLLVQSSHNPSPPASAHFPSPCTLPIAPEAWGTLGTSTLACQLFASQDGQHYQRQLAAGTLPPTKKPTTNVVSN